MGEICPTFTLALEFALKIATHNMTRWCTELHRTVQTVLYRGKEEGEQKILYIYCTGKEEVLIMKNSTVRVHKPAQKCIDIFQPNIHVAHGHWRVAMAAKIVWISSRKEEDTDTDYWSKKENVAV